SLPRGRGARCADALALPGGRGANGLTALAGKDLAAPNRGRTGHGKTSRSVAAAVWFRRRDPGRARRRHRTARLGETFQARPQAPRRIAADARGAHDASRPLPREGPSLIR